MTIEKQRTNFILKLCKQCSAFSLSVLFIWVLGYFCDSLNYYQYDERLTKFIHSPNTVHEHRSEGVAKTHKGLFGVNAIEDISKDSRKKIVIWGDSYVEAHQVNEYSKIPQVVTAKLYDKLGDNLMCFGVVIFIILSTFIVHLFQKFNFSYFTLLIENKTTPVILILFNMAGYPFYPKKFQPFVYLQF